MRAVVLALLLPMLAGCTYILIEKSKGDVASPGRRGVTTKLVSASVMRPASGDGDEHLYLCFSRSSAADPSEKFFLVQVPERYPFADDARAAAPFRTVGNSLVLSAGTDSDAAWSCDAPRDQKQIDRIAILTADPGQSVLLPADTPAAMVVSYSSSGDGFGVGYTSAAPVFGGYRQVSLDLTHSALYSDRDGAKPYLLLLTPLAVAADAVGAVVVGIPLAIGLTRACWDAPKPCH